MIRLLIVDDAPFIRELVQLNLRDQGISVVAEAEDGAEAVVVARTVRPDVILMDLALPRMNGIEATEEILAELPETKVIAFSTADQESVVARAIQAGCCDFLSKPFTSEELVKVIHRAMADRGSSKEA
ncbi:MAG TPA: response regulator [Pseudobdellovibrionaceae bacterium]|nr:response regulator [Pseudobdellovibrionaceae bacterium]